MTTHFPAATEATDPYCLPSHGVLSHCQTSHGEHSHCPTSHGAHSHCPTSHGAHSHCPTSHGAHSHCLTQRVQAAVNSSSFSRGQVLMMRSGGTSLATARSHP